MSPATTRPPGRGIRPAQADARAAYRRMSEDELLESIRALAVPTGWLLFHAHDSRKSMGPGFPDCVAVSARQRRVIFAELKNATRMPEPEQVVWLTALAETGAEVALWRPADWFSGLIPAVLRGAPMPPLDPASLTRNGRNRT